MVYEIAYDLIRPGQNYAGLHNAIKNLGSWCKPLESTWLVKSNGNAANIRDALKPHIDQNDRLLVAGVSGDWASYNIPQECADWLKQNL